MRSEISKIGLGTWAFGGRAYGPMDDRDATAIVERAYELGLRFFDTAHIYANGRSEEILGETLKNRTDAQICTKIGYDTSSGKAIKRYDPDFLDVSLGLSLTRLRREKIDLLLLHNPPSEVLAAGEVFEWLSRKKDEGKILAWGLSVYDSAKDAEMGLDAGATAIEARYSPIRRDVLDELSNGRWKFDFIARSPFDSGLLTGKYSSESKFANTDLRSAMKPETLNVYQEIAQTLSALVSDGTVKTLAELAIRFSAFAPKVARVIPGAKSVSQLEANVNAVLMGPLPQHALQLIDSVRNQFLTSVTNG